MRWNFARVWIVCGFYFDNIARLFERICLLSLFVCIYFCYVLSCFVYVEDMLTQWWLWFFFLFPKDKWQRIRSWNSKRCLVIWCTMSTALAQYHTKKNTLQYSRAKDEKKNHTKYEVEEKYTTQRRIFFFRWENMDCSCITIICYGANGLKHNNLQQCRCCCLNMPLYWVSVFSFFFAPLAQPPPPFLSLCIPFVCVNGTTLDSRICSS